MGRVLPRGGIIVKRYYCTATGRFSFGAISAVNWNRLRETPALLAYSLDFAIFAPSYWRLLLP
jgi:hypothetical protein